MVRLVMDMSQVIEIAVAGAGLDDVSIRDLQAAQVDTAVVGSLSQIVSELVQNAAAFSRPGQRVRVSGGFDGSEYVVSVSDDGIGIPGAMLDALNDVLESPGGTGEGPNLGISLIARLAARSGIGVRLMDGEPGTTARVTVPAASVFGGPPAEESLHDILPKPTRRAQPLATIDLTRYEGTGRPPTEHVFSNPEVPADDAEAFLEKIFGPLRSRSQRWERPAPRSDPNGVSVRPPADREPKANTSSLQVRVPGTNFTIADDEQSAMSSEAAIDIRNALERYQAGRADAGSV